MTRFPQQNDTGGSRISITRRELLAAPLALAASCAAPRDTVRTAAEGKRKPVATVITEYRFNSHADVIVGRLLDGYEYNGEKRQPRVRVASMYTDQTPANDLSRPMAAKHGVPIFPSIREALTLGGNTLAVEGVVLVGEHGNYPLNEKGQHLYPRFELFSQVVDTRAEVGESLLHPKAISSRKAMERGKILLMVPSLRQGVLKNARRFHTASDTR